MVRMIFALSAIALLVGATGCRVCSHPYDYCGPLFDGRGGEHCCCPMARAGSVLASGEMGGCNCGMSGAPVIEGAPQELAPIPQNELTHVPPLQSVEPEFVESGPALFQAQPSQPGRGSYPRTDPQRWAAGSQHNSQLR